MKRRMRVTSWLLLLLPGLVSGCGWWQSDEDVERESPAPILAEDEETEKNLPAVKAEPLELKLSIGDRFPLLKTVEQTLTQASPQGPTSNHSKLELLMAITVEDLADDGRKRLGVHYQRVRYSHDVAGEQSVYDSSNPQAVIPSEVLVYHGLVHNKFSFWLAADNQIIDLVGFNDFLNRCVRHIPVSQRQAVLRQFIETSSEEGIANFVDDSIGLLPYNAAAKEGGTIVAVGQSWSRERRLSQPLPLFLNTVYTLKALNDRVAEIEIVGRIRPSTFAPAHQTSWNAQVTVQGGHSFGSCLIDRKTGLPIHSRVERSFDMQVTASDGSWFTQKKTIVTTIKAFPQQDAGMVIGQTSGGLKIED